MPTYSVSKTWNVAETLTAADLNGIEAQVATFLNTTKLDGDNISATAEYTFGGIVLGSGGPASPDGGNLHSFNGDASAAAHADGDEGVFENSAAAGISILSGASSTGNILFGDTGDNDIGKVSYNHSTNALAFTTNATTALTLSSAQLATFAGAIQANSTVTVGVDDTGYDVQFFGATAGAHMLWDESADDLKLVGAAGLTVAGLAALTTATISSTSTISGDMTFNDNVKVTLGTGGDADLYYDATNVVLNPKVVGSGVFNVLGNMGVGIAHTDGTLHVHTATAGAVAANASYNDFIVESSGATGMSLLGPDANGLNIAFGSPSNNDYAILGGFYNAGSPYMLFNVNESERMRIDSSGNVGIGETNPSTFPLQVKSASAGSGMAQLEATNASHYAALALKNDSTTWNIAHPGTSAASGITNQLYFHDGSSIICTMADDGLFINDNSTSEMDKGLTVNQGSADNVAISLKSSDVAHGYTSLMETDTYGAQLKIAADTGGLKTYAVAESSVGKAYQIQAYCGAPGTTRSTSQEGIFTYYAAVHNGSNSVVACAENSVMYSFRARNAANSDVTLMTIDEDGDIAVDGSATVGTFDTEMDYQLVRGARQVLQPELLTGAKDLATKYSDLLHENRIVIRGEDGRPYLNLKRGLLLSWDMGYQIGQKVYEEMDPRIAKLEQKLALLEGRN